MTPAYVREILIGAAAALLFIGINRWLTPAMLVPAWTPEMLGLAAFAFLAAGAFAWWVVGFRPAGTRFAAASALTLPVLFSDAIETALFPQFFPRFDPAADFVFSTGLILACAGPMTAGYLRDRLDAVRLSPAPASL